MSLVMRRFYKGIVLRAITDESSISSADGEGALFHNSSDAKIKAYIQGSVREIVTNSQSQNLTNKTLVDVVLNNSATGVTGSSLETNLSSSAASNKLPTAAAAKSYADTAASTAASTKEPSITAGTTSQYFRGDKTFQTLDGAAVINTPAGTISSITVQAAINELDTEKQSTLVSGTNIKTINGSSILGSGDLVISGGGGSGITIQDGPLVIDGAATNLTFSGGGATVTQLSPGTVEVSIAPSGGGGASYADTSISALNIDWSTGTTFYKAITATSTFTFSNVVAGKTITVALTNATGTTYAVTFPTTKQEPGGLETSVFGNTTTIFTFVSINGIIYCSSFSGVA